MPQPRGCRGSSKVRAVNCISHICRFPSPIKTHFFVFGCAECENLFASVGIFHRSGNRRGESRERYAADPLTESFFLLHRRDSNGGMPLFPGLPSRRRSPTDDIGGVQSKAARECGKTENGAVCIKHTAPFYCRLSAHARGLLLAIALPKSRCRPTKSSVLSEH